MIDVDRLGAVVTGGAGGIGLAVATRLAADGYHVYVLDADAAAVRQAAATKDPALAIDFRLVDVRDVDRLTAAVDEAMSAIAIGHLLGCSGRGSSPPCCTRCAGGAPPAVRPACASASARDSPPSGKPPDPRAHARHAVTNHPHHPCIPVPCSTNRIGVDVAPCTLFFGAGCHIQTLVTEAG
jgi:NAD(P)-dependent dehydrogenase (short-subunit alcohol dehydrogenase family)